MKFQTQKKSQKKYKIKLKKRKMQTLMKLNCVTQKKNSYRCNIKLPRL